MIRAMRESLIAFLCAVLIYLPLISVYPPTAGAEATRKPPTSTSKSAFQPTHTHKPGELLIKFRESAPPAQREQILSLFAKEHKNLRGRESLKRLKLKDGLDLGNTLITARQLEGVIEWAEPNYVVTRAAGKLQAASTPNDAQFGAQWALVNTGQQGGTPGADIGALAGWGQTTGARSTIVAIIDTGVDTRHPDLARNLWRNEAEASGKKHEDEDQNGFADDVSGWNFVNDTPDVTDEIVSRVVEIVFHRILANAIVMSLLSFR